MKEDWRGPARRKACVEALKRIRDGMVIGLGSGTTMAIFIEELSKRIEREQIEVLAVPSSTQAELEAAARGIKLTSLTQYPELDLAVDGADVVDVRNLNLIKGGGAALTREKIVDSAAKAFIVVVDEGKLSKGLVGPVPVEVVPFGLKATVKKIMGIGGRPKLREGSGKVGPVVTDNGNFILDVDFGEIRDPGELDARLKSIPGVVETGLFLNMADEIYVGLKEGGVQTLRRV